RDDCRGVKPVMVCPYIPYFRGALAQTVLLVLNDSDDKKGILSSMHQSRPYVEFMKAAVCDVKLNKKYCAYMTLVLVLKI
ncbi:MAG: hypothetical protein ACRC16_14675, partial [Aeromonas salmonicida]